MEWIDIIMISAIALSAILFFMAWSKDRMGLRSFFRPLTTATIILYAFAQNDFFSHYEYLLISGLILAALGDLFVALPRKGNVISHFLLSMAVFTISLFCMQDPGPYFMWVTLLPVMLGVIYFILMIHKRATRYNKWLIVYVLILGNLLVQSSGRTWYIAEDGAGMLFAGALLLVISESAKAFSVFRKGKPVLFVAYLSLYWISLTLIGLSL